MRGTILGHYLIWIFTVLVLLGGMSAPAWAGDFEDGMTAYERGDYAAALQLWKPLAEQGVADAQFNVGHLYATGEGVQQDYVQAYKWFDLAASQYGLIGQAQVEGRRDALAAKMTAAQIEEAQRLAKEWLAAHPQ